MSLLFGNKSAEDLYGFLSPYVEPAQDELKRVFLRDSGFEIADICKRMIEAGGKRLRPLLALLACEAVSGGCKKALPVSVATELAHTLGIIQDDIFDQATLRRSVKPIYVACGIPTAILASDYLFLRMIEVILEMAESNGASERVTLGVLNVVVDAGLEAVEGEHMDLKLTEKGEATVEEWTQVARKKTSSLIRAALEVGALVGGGTGEEIEALRNYGQKLGIAYQITDDVLGLIGAADAVGKDVGADITNKRMTIVVTHALEKSSAQSKAKILDILRGQGSQQKGTAENLGVFSETGSIEYARRLASEYAERAVADLCPLKSSKAKSILQAVPVAIVNRQR